MNNEISSASTALPSDLANVGERPAIPGRPAKEETEARTSGRNRTRSRIVQALAVLLLIAVGVVLWRLWGERSKPPAAPRAEAVAVEMAAASEKDVPILVKGIGNVEALSTVSVRSQIEGTLQRVYFTPGQEVKKSDTLFTIDPRPLQAALSQAEANLAKAMAAVSQARDVVARDQATAKNSQIIAQRDLKLVEAGVIAREEYDNAVSKAQSDDATVRADQASVSSLQSAAQAERAGIDSARVQLGYTTIRAPISGKTGNLAVTAGNLVRANDTTALVTITQTAPIYVTFAVPEPDLERIRRYQSSKDFRVEAILPDDPSHTAQGKLSLIDNTVDMTTGTIKLKATFDNGDRRLFPGQFVNVVLTLGIQQGATVVPSQAVQIGQQDSSFVYVVKPDMTAEVRNVKTGSSLEAMTVIEDGLRSGEQVITDGQLRLVPGSKVQARSAQDRSPGAARGGPGGGGGSGGNSGYGAPGTGAGSGNPANPAAGPATGPSSGGTGGGSGRGGQGSGGSGGSSGAGSGGSGSGGSGGAGSGSGGPG